MEFSLFVFEEDKELRERILYVAWETSAFFKLVMSSSGQELDDIAAQFGLKRRVL